MTLLIGLGNPGSKYSNNRHNVGFRLIDQISSRHGFAPWRDRFQGEYASGNIAGTKVHLLKPQTYMNNSGQAAGEALRYFKLGLDDVSVIYDELDLVPGKVRVKKGGGSGGHNGIRSIDAHIGNEFQRVRVGIGHPGQKNRVAQYVLSDFSKADQSWLSDLDEGFAEHAGYLAGGDFAGFMNKIALTQQKSNKPERRSETLSISGKSKNNATDPITDRDGPMAAMLKTLLGKK